jgi:cyclic-di-GMP-binding protein
MPSFDITSELDWVEINNVVDQVTKELNTRFDFKGSDSKIELNQKDKLFTINTDDDFKLSQVMDIITAKSSKRGVDTRIFDAQDSEKVSGNKVKQIVKLKEGISQELGKKIVKLIKDSKMKVQTSIQADTVRITGGKRDELQEAIALVKKEITEIPVNFGNFRD